MMDVNDVIFFQRKMMGVYRNVRSYAGLVRPVRHDGRERKFCLANSHLGDRDPPAMCAALLVISAVNMPPKEPLRIRIPLRQMIVARELMRIPTCEREMALKEPVTDPFSAFD